MPTPFSDRSIRTWARIAGLGYLVIIATGLFAEFAVRGSLIVAGDAAATAANIRASESLFRIAIAGELLMLVSDVVVALALWVVFERVSRSLALLAAFLRVTHAAVVGVNLLTMFVPLFLLGDGGHAAGLGASGVDALVALSLQTQAVGYQIGLVFFGVHCLVLGILILRSGYVPKALGVLLFFAAAGYLIDTFGRALVAGYETQAATFTLIVLLPAFVAEVSFCLWLLIKGVRLERA